MRINKIIQAVIVLMVISVSAFSQDRRTPDTKIADLLAQFPAGSTQYTNKLLDDMLLLGEEGLVKVCDMIIPAGPGDDTKARFAIESLSRYLSQNGKKNEREKWEKICISFAGKKEDPGVRDFFFKQLQLIGGDQAVEALKRFLSDKNSCSAAVAAMTAVGGGKAEQVLAESLKDKSLPCAAAVMNALAAMKSKSAVPEFIAWTSDQNVSTRASAFNALAMSGAPEAYPVLLNAAKSLQYRWDPAGVTSSLLNYAKTVGENGDMKTMDKICKLLISKCNDSQTFQNKTAALQTYVGFHGIDAMPLIQKAAGHADLKYRNAAINMSASIKGNEVVKKWIDFYPKATSAAKPEIIRWLGSRKDGQAVPLVSASLLSSDAAVRTASAEAIVKLKGKEAAKSLIEYLLKFTSSDDQQAAASAFKSIAGKDEVALLKPVLKEGPSAAKKSAIEIMAWSRAHEYFAEVFPFANSSDEAVKAAAIKALADLAGPDDQTGIINLLKSNTNKEYISDIQAALTVAANKVADPEKRSSEILKAMSGKSESVSLVPVLARTGGRAALAVVLKEFEEGDADMKAVCFQALSSWKDYSASSALYEICASGNKTYDSRAFNGYVKQVRSADIPGEQKLLLFRKIMPFALTTEQKNIILAEAGKLKTYQSLFFVAEYLNDPATYAAAARSAMTIALPETGMPAGLYGKNVREILLKAVPGIAGPESDYEKEMVNKYLASMPPDEGFVKMFNGRDLSGWQGLVENPVARAKMKPSELAQKQTEADKKVPLTWSVKDGCIWFNGKGDNLCSIKEYGDFEMLVDWKITKKGDSGIYLRGSPQVQIWDTSRIDVGAQVGSGGLYNNQKNPSKPLKVADNPIGDWNTFRIIMVGEKVSVWLNGELVVDNVVMENYWDRSIPIFPRGPIELQAHGTDLAFRDIYVREISEKDYNLTAEEKAEGFISLFNGRNLDNWTGNKVAYAAEDGMIVIRPDEGSGGNLYTEKEYSDFIYRFEFQLTPGANNGIGIRAPLTGDAAYLGMEIQVLDNTAAVYANLQPYQYHGSVYGVIPAKREYLKPVGEWNSEEIFAQGTHIKVTLNGTVIVDGDIAGPRDNGTMDHNDHPGLKNASGHIGFLGHGSIVKFRNIRIKDLSK